MKKMIQLLPILIFCHYSGQVGGAELLGKISDETASAANQEKAAAEHKPKIIYRVICTAEGEMSPECGQAPVDDDIDNQTAQETAPEPGVPAKTPVEAVQTGTATPAAMAEKPQSKTAKPAAATKPSKHKKSAGKPAKQKLKPAKRKKRH